MFRFLSRIVRIAICFAAFGCVSMVYSDTGVVVSIAPLKYYVNQLTDSKVPVTVLVPPGANAHTYEITPRQIAALRDARVWIRIGDPFETPGVKLLEGNRHLTIVDVRANIDLLGPTDCSHPECMKAGADPHVWMSAREAQQIAKTVAAALEEAYPAQKNVIAARLKVLEYRLQQLDQQLTTKLAPFKGDTLIVSHPAFGYFCRDYGLHQLAVEDEGREPTPKRLVDLIEQARKSHAKVVLLQRQFPSKGAERIAATLDLPMCTVDPYEVDLPKNLHHLANCISQ